MTVAAPLPIDEPVRGVPAYTHHPGILRLVGLEQIRLFQHGQLPHTPLWYLTGLQITESAVGSATYRLPMTGWLANPAGVTPGGVLAFAADAALGNAIHTALGPRRIVATWDLALDYVRPPDARADAVTVTARLIHAGRQQALSEATVADTGGHLLAHATSRCVLMDVPGELPEPPTTPVAEPQYVGPHPFERPAVGRPLPQDIWNTTTGLQILRAAQRHDLPRSPLANLLGSELRDVADGLVVCEIPASGWFANPAGTLYGGLQAAFADYAILCAVQSTAPVGTSLATLDLKVRYLRPVPVDGRALQARARVVHRGRRLAVATAELVSADGKRAALADASVMLRPGQQWTQPFTLLDERLPHTDPTAHLPALPGGYDGPGVQK